MIELFGFFLNRLLLLLLQVLPIFAAVWLGVLLALVLLFRTVKKPLRARITHLDETLREWALGLRFRIKNEDSSDRVGRTWFFRFWTNFASAPSLSLFCVLIPFLAFYRAHSVYGFAPAQAFSKITLWIFPGVCYSGALLLSFVVKKVFRRVRPPRKGKAFGYKLKDASFPSGHSLTSFCFWIPMALVVLYSGFVATGVALTFLMLAAIIVLLTGLSRVYLGVHFPSDVLGGYFMAAIWCAVSLPAFYNRVTAPF